MKTIFAWVLLAVVQLGHAATDTQLERILALRLAGDYQQAIDLASSELAADARDARLLNLLGELRADTGNLAAAAQRFAQAVELPGSEQLMARLNLARIHLQQGEREAAENLLREIRTAHRTQPGLRARDLYAVASATWHLGESDPQLFKEAVRLFDDAIERDPTDPLAGIALGELLLEKYNNQEALQVFQEVLRANPEHPLALLGLARSQHFDYSSDAVLTTLGALEINPNLVPARVFMARLFIELEQYDDARHEAERALEVNPVSLEALAMLGVIAHLERDPAEFERIESRILELNPGYARFYTALADLASQNRLYRDAAGFAATAIELDPQSWRGYGLLGMNQLRLGLMQAGRANLERSFSGDPYNVWIKNTLQLADSFDEFVEIEAGRFVLVLHGRENALLREYVEDLARLAYRHFKARYRHEPEQPIRVELYPDHADFSVRSVGLAGVGLLGVCFGPVVAMDSPSARERGAFNWGSTLWHELAHVFHLSITGNRVPRWFSEGLAVYEEHLARPGWGGDVDPGFLRAYLDGQLLPLSRLNNGFVRPSYPEQVIHSYYQASLVFEFIETRWGSDVVRQILYAFRDSVDPETEVPRALQLDAEALDAAFDAYLRDKYAVALAALREDPDASAGGSDRITPETALPDKYFDQLNLGNTLLQQGDLELAELFLLKAQQLFPQYAGADGSYWQLAGLYLQRGEPARAEAQLEKMIGINAEHYEAHLLLAKLRGERGDHAAAAAALEAALYIYPYDPGPHRDLAGHLESLQQWRKVARERRALLALDPVDKAEAYYQLAYAYERAGDRSSAREQILYALEIAPNFRQAQELLLSLRQAGAAASEAQ
ncbi:MAG: tetratricopeptide repeat protein [Gammaproteobacteria bacterium]|nr:tetratricopeptide repeat protein [Gammaproteobacteria bacterium]